MPRNCPNTLSAEQNYGKGDAEAWTETLEGWREIKASHISLNTMNAGFDTPEKHIEAVKEFTKAVGVS